MNTKKSLKLLFQTNEQQPTTVLIIIVIKQLVNFHQDVNKLADVQL